MATIKTKPPVIDRGSTPESRHEQLMALLAKWRKITLQYNNDKIGEQLLWCFEHCQGHFRDIQHFDQKVWYFENEQDAALFALRWA